MVDIGAYEYQGTGSAIPISVTVQASVAGCSFTVDGTKYATVQTFSWVPGASHTIATSSPQSGGAGTQYVWSTWSDGGAISHTVSPTADGTTYTANFTTQYYLTMNGGAGGTVSPSSGWYNSGSDVSISATPSSGYTFSGWTGSGNGSYSGLSDPGLVTINGPVTETASFAAGGPGSQLVQNGGFETGDFSYWVLTGSLADNKVTSIAEDVHSGSYGARLGAMNSLGYLSQTMPTVAGQSYLLSCWLHSPGDTPNEFLVSWNGSTLFDQTNVPTFAWTNLQFLVQATGSVTTQVVV